MLVVNDVSTRIIDIFSMGAQDAAVPLATLMETTKWSNSMDMLKIGPVYWRSCRKTARRQTDGRTNRVYFIEQI